MLEFDYRNVGIIASQDGRNIRTQTYLHFDKIIAGQFRNISKMSSFALEFRIFGKWRISRINLFLTTWLTMDGAFSIRRFGFVSSRNSSYIYVCITFFYNYACSFRNCLRFERGNCINSHREQFESKNIAGKIYSYVLRK